MARKQKRTLFVPLFLGGLVLLLVALMVINRFQQKELTAGLINLTEVKGTIDISKGILYDKQPKLGSDDAKVKVVETADFKCPVCANWSVTHMPQFKKDYIDTGKVQLYFMNYSFIDRDSHLAASAGEAIFHQNNDKFWEFEQKLYANQGNEKKIWATQKFLLNFVKKNIAGIDYAQFEKDLKGKTYMLDVKEDYKIGGSLGVNGTPQFFVNGVHLDPSATYEDLTKAIDAELAK
ncbi:MAG: DsbA family protein [Gorillibacterium sp.]|nr:DsbA family protein [Gorillibacterium sp.]